MTNWGMYEEELKKETTCAGVRCRLEELGAIEKSDKLPPCGERVVQFMEWAAADYEPPKPTSEDVAALRRVRNYCQGGEGCGACPLLGDNGCGIDRMPMGWTLPGDK